MRSCGNLSVSAESASSAVFVLPRMTALAVRRAAAGIRCLDVARMLRYEGRQHDT
jgi:hypothetical protein